ncbi:Ankyrin repeat containing protein [Colletotrichum higginsianum IMI 349063]|uniref:Ankyrin repeat containing protein n=1 Tax=Colletotrichum higginsianum (strain IMI 349063) TaxID=759273 RepID=A0A1B7Y446_COLHI|nr:Ankyrin repeat containing protein [Colletotrichum higginsianum IMI 349063]OBR06782.1 Ankyrin repeat containing protein [Colletotrichum higginsianum IMI 349063]
MKSLGSSVTDSSPAFTPAMAAPRGRIPNADWLQYKSAIRQMILTEKVSLVDARHRLEENGFAVTKAQLEYRLKKWGFRKRVPKNRSADIWRYVGSQIASRKRQGNIKGAMLNGQRQKVDKVTKDIRRHELVTLLQSITAPLMASIPLYWTDDLVDKQYRVV